MENTPNKMMTGKEKGLKKKFFFPDVGTTGITVEASTQEEAHQKLQDSFNK